MVIRFGKKWKIREKAQAEPLSIHGFKMDPKWNKLRVIRFIGITFYIGGYPGKDIPSLGRNEFWLDGYAAQALYERLKDINDEQ